MQNFFLTALFLVFAASFSQKPNNTYQFLVDLTKVENDKLKVELIAPKISSSEIVYHFPKIIPGIYEDFNYGRYISNFKAFDKNGIALAVKKTDLNSYKIENAKKLHHIVYWVDDSWDSPEVAGDFIIEPAGTDFEENKVFVLNNHCLFGYFEAMKNTLYQVKFIKPEGFYGSTSLVTSESANSYDLYKVPTYFELVDSPFMYNKPDTTDLEIGGAKIEISVYSPRKKVKSSEVASKLKVLLEAQKEYLGGKLPIKKYAFIIYLSEADGLMSYAALEHSQSSFYFMPEAAIDEISENVINIAAHEFFHIVTPLNIHSEEIGNFDYSTPKMSEHLWFYEGLTEYATGHSQLKSGQINFSEYLKRIQGKIATSKNVYNDTLSFTTMSAHVLEKEYKNQYLNVYQKGALIGLCLDVKLRELSHGKYGTQNLAADLSERYGKNKPFKDAEFFDAITKITGFPEIRDFFTKYVEGTSPLPLIKTLESIGVKHETPERTKNIGLGFLSSNLNMDQNTKRLFLMNDDGINAFGKQLGLKAKDELVSINGLSLLYENLKKSRQAFLQNTKEGDLVTFIVMRKDSNDNFTEVKLSSHAFAVEDPQKYLLTEMENPTSEQKQLRNWWMKKN
jgi:predicted metalloprotease with PDZ domain